MRHRKLTTVDVCEVTGYTRHQLRGLIDELPHYFAQVSLPRVARGFSFQDLLVLSVIHILEKNIGIQRAMVVPVAPLLQQALSGPKKANRGAKLIISFTPPTVKYVATGMPASDGVMLSLGPIFERVDHYLLPDGAERQTDLKLGPVLITNERKKRAG
jgi:hypothetical protein